MKRRAALLVAVATLALTGCGGGSATPTVDPALVARAEAAGIPACAFNGGSGAAASKELTGVWPCLGGGSVDLATGRGRPVVLIHYAQWCPPCRAEMPILAQVLPGITGNGPGEPLILLVNSAETRPDWSIDLLVETGMTGMPVVDDPEWKLMEQLGGPHSLPRTFLIDADGTVTRHEGGWKSVDELRAALRAVGVAA